LIVCHVWLIKSFVGWILYGQSDTINDSCMQKLCILYGFAMVYSCKYISSLPWIRNVLQICSLFTSLKLRHHKSKRKCLWSIKYYFFVCISFYARKQILLSMRLSHLNSVCSSVCPSVRRVDQSQAVQARITKSSPLAAWKTLVSGTVKLFHKFEGGYPERGY